MLKGKNKLIALVALSAIALSVAMLRTENNPANSTVGDAAQTTKFARPARTSETDVAEPPTTRANGSSHEERVLQREDELAEQSEANRRALVAQHLVVLERKAELAQKAGRAEQARRLRQRAQHLSALR